jgi:hypothetical protein
MQHFPLTVANLEQPGMSFIKIQYSVKHLSNVREVQCRVSDDLEEAMNQLLEADIRKITEDLGYFQHNIGTDDDYLVNTFSIFLETGPEDEGVHPGQIKEIIESFDLFFDEYAETFKLEKPGVTVYSPTTLLV